MRGEKCCKPLGTGLDQEGLREELSKASRALGRGPGEGLCPLTPLGETGSSPWEAS